MGNRVVRGTVMVSCKLNTDKGQVRFFIDKRNNYYEFIRCDGESIVTAIGEEYINQIRTVAHNMSLDLGFGDVGGRNYNWIWELSPDDPVCRIEIWHIRTGVGYRFYLNCDDVNKFTKTILNEVGDYS